MLHDVHGEGPLGSCRRVLEEIIADIDNGLPVEEERFPELIVDSTVSPDDIRHSILTLIRARLHDSAGAEKTVTLAKGGVAGGDPSECA